LEITHHQAKIVNRTVRLVIGKWVICNFPTPSGCDFQSQYFPPLRGPIIRQILRLSQNPHNRMLVRTPSGNSIPIFIQNNSP
jgi:hypothetical protein